MFEIYILLYKWRIFLQLREQNELTDSIPKIKLTGGMCFYVKCTRTVIYNEHKISKPRFIE